MRLNYFKKYMVFLLAGSCLPALSDSLWGETVTSPDYPLIEVAGHSQLHTISQEKTVEQLLNESNFRGGLVVHVGCATGEQTAALVINDNSIVQGLNTDRKEIERARQYARSFDLDGRLSFRKWDGGSLPYTDNLVNVLFWEEPDTETLMKEIMRVLAPKGIAFIKQTGGWNRVVKSWPEEFDEWPHFRFDAGSTGASGDKRVGPPRHIQWEAGPRYMRSHEIETGLSSIVSAGGRLYYIIDDGPIGVTDARFPSRWSLVCRDAFNGILLWKRTLPEWGWQAWKGERVNDPNTWLGLRTKPADVDRIMVADGNCLYITLGFGAPVSSIDGATGDLIVTYEQTTGAVEFILLKGVLLVRTDHPVSTITAIRATDGEVLWKREADVIVARSLCATGEQVFFHSRSNIISLDLRTGHELWTRTTDRRPAAVIAHSDAVLVMQSGATLALSTSTGEEIWQGPGTGMRGRNPDTFVVNDLVWSGRPHFEARNVKTGELVKKMNLQKVLESGHHRRCYTDRATVNFMITGERGSEFLDFHQDDHTRHNWVRGPCITGMVPANGIFYVPPHQCFCYPAVRMDGFFAFVSGLTHNLELLSGNLSPRLEKGPAFGQGDGNFKSAGDSWPAYRQNAKRSGSVSSTIQANLDPMWSVQIGGNLTQAVACEVNAYVVRKDAATVHCIELETGRLVWNHTVTGRIDSPPALHGGYVYFGSRDGFVYSLRAGDGELAWHFRAAPEHRQIVSYDRLESSWPVHGSVLILDDILYCSAGRSGFIDHGIYLYALDPESGNIIHQNKLEGPVTDISQASEAFHEEGYRSDLMSTDGTYIYMGRTVLDKELQEVVPESVHMVGTQRGDNLEYRIMPGMRLVATGTFLDDTFWNRTWWMYSYVWPGFHYAQQAPKSGQMLVFDEKNTYTVKHYHTRNRHTPMLFPGSGYLLFADDNNHEPLFYRGEGEPRPIEWEPVLPQETRWTIYQDAAVDKGPGFTRAKPALWTSWVDVRIEAMLLAGDHLFIAGTPDVVLEDDPLAGLEGRMGGILRVVSAKDGSTLAEYSLDSRPVFDGLSATHGRLIITTQKGEVLCMGSKAVAASSIEDRDGDGLSKFGTHGGTTRWNSFEFRRSWPRTRSTSMNPGT